MRGKVLRSAQTPHWLGFGGDLFSCSSIGTWRLGTWHWRSHFFWVAGGLLLFRGGLFVVSRGADGATTPAAKFGNRLWLEPAGAGDDGEDSNDAEATGEHFQAQLRVGRIRNSSADFLVRPLRRAGFSGIQQAARPAELFHAGRPGYGTLGGVV